MDQTYLPLREAADRYGIHYDRLRRAAYDGRLLTIRTEGRFLVRPAEVERFLAEGGRAPRIEALSRRDGAAHARVIAVAIPKGGTGKTTTTLNLGVALAEQGQRVLVVDVDPQANLTLALGVDPARVEYGLQEAIRRFLEHFEADLERAIVHTADGIDLVPATVRLNESNTDLPHALEPQKVLKRLLDPLRDRYDFILLDTLPYLGVLVQNALAAADEVLVPLQPHALANESAQLMLAQITRMQRSGLNPTLRIGGFLFTQVESQANIQRDYMAFGRELFGRDAKVFETTIENRLIVQESQSAAIRQSLFRYRPTDPVTQAYRQLALEVLRAA